MIIRSGDGDGEPTVSANGRLSFDIALKAGQAWHRCLIYDFMDGVERMRRASGASQGRVTRQKPAKNRFTNVPGPRSATASPQETSGIRTPTTGPAQTTRRGLGL